MNITDIESCRRCGALHRPLDLNFRRYTVVDNYCGRCGLYFQSVAGFRVRVLDLIRFVNGH